MIKTNNFEPIIFGLINHTICFYDRPPEKPEAKIDQRWKNFISNHEEISLTLKADPMTLEKSFNWILNNVAPSLKLIRDFGNVYHVNLLGLILQVAKLNEEGEKMINSVYENPEWFKGEIKFYRRVLERKLQQKRKAERRKQ